MTRREELYPVIKRMREEDGLKWREIGAALGISKPTAQGYYTDPDGSKVWARKHRTACRDCGVPTNSGSPGKGYPTERCAPCADEHIRACARLRIIERMQDWAERFGDPPVASDWNRAPRTRRLHPAAALRQDDASDEQWPSTAGVQHTFGSWNAAIEAAGFMPLRVGGRMGDRWAA